MSEARERYYELFENNEIGILQEIQNYVSELEQQKAELMEVIKYEFETMCETCNKYDICNNVGCNQYQEMNEVLNKYK